MRIFSTGWSEEFDGPGRRWVLYLKGCNYRCRWCANPEGLSSGDDIMFYPDRGNHLERVCPHGALERDDLWTLDRRRCTDCADQYCVRVWRHPAFEAAGEDVEPEEIVERAKRYRPFFQPSGGVTFGGGEPTLQADDLRRTLSGLRAEGIHTAVETNAAETLTEDLASLADLLICDLKCVTAEIHEAWTGADNRAVLENLKRAAEKQACLLVRVPLVTGMNDTEEERRKIADFIGEMAQIRTASGAGGDFRLEVLRLHHFGEPKYEALGMDYEMGGVAPPSREEALEFVSRIAQSGLDVRLGG